jgi:hypothetical protein
MYNACKKTGCLKEHCSGPQKEKGDEADLHYPGKHTLKRLWRTGDYLQRTGMIKGSGRSKWQTHNTES